MAEDFRVEQLDHIHVFVPDQYEAAAWYKRILGLEILSDYEDWATGGGPLTISSDDGNTSLALFQKGPERAGESKRTVAFRVDGDGFMTFLARLERHELQDAQGERVTIKDIEDHGKSFSIYFCDPYGNPYELTTYEYRYVSARLQELANRNDR
jgi:catechol 2,3-dioxygenase-like lactoylglutathione lyase family enzyme